MTGSQSVMKALRAITFYILTFVFVVLSSNAKAQELYYYNTNRQVFRVDVNTGLATLLVSHQAIPGQDGTDITFDPSGELYVISVFGGILRIDTTSGMLTPIVTLPAQSGFSNYRGLTADSEGVLYASNANGQIFSLDLNTNQVLNLGNIGAGIIGDLTFYDGQIITSTTNPDLLVQVDTTPPASFTSTAALFGGPFINNNGLSYWVEVCGNTRTFVTVPDIDKDGFSGHYEFIWPNVGFSFICSLPGDAAGLAIKNEYLSSIPSLGIDSVSATSSCGAGNISVEAIGGIPPFTYALNGGPFQPDGVFTELPSGLYSVFVEDSLGCSDSIKVEVITAEPLELLVDDFVEPTCDEFNGEVVFSATGGTGALEYSINGIDFFENGLFDNLTAGAYDLTVRDEEGCLDQTAFVLENQNEGCDISVPNVFSPNGDGRNDVFIIQGLAGRMNSFRIFNSWGTQVYSRVNYLNDWSPDNLSEGTYYYVLSVEELEDLTGFVTLVR